MNIPTQQLISPGAIDYDQKRHNAQTRYQKAVEKAQFLTDRQKEEWALLGYSLENDQLKEAEQLIISKNLSHLKTRHQLEKLKPKK
ncbi:hypothetical protein JW752_02065 [Candidatus Peregrinibacteria bacterium]|nr:hypothetical protein [Candidatus Peregrinibacteria bacterium]